ncbi:MAG TPA: hypothetical protein ENH92_03260 [Ectothiorhodospiraceae bacterium]|nr:hypothetical protein [Ectothiorhodospiraceae bacterium]
MRLLVIAMFFLSLTACTNVLETDREQTQYKTPTSVADIIKEMSDEEANESAVPKKPTSIKKEKITGSKVVDLSKVTCRSGDDIRRLTRTTMVDGSCQVIYQREGRKSTVASKESDEIYCKMIYTRMRLNFIDSGFSCK